MKVLFVCLGNICRSPAAEGVFLDLVEKKGCGDRFEVDSAGTSSYHRGELPDLRMRQAAEKRGVVLESRSRLFQREDFQKFDHIFVMDQSNLKNVLSLARSDEERGKVRLFGSLADRYKEVDIPDPYFGGDEGFEKVLDMVENAGRNFLKECGL